MKEDQKELTQEQIDTWKKQFGSVYKTIVSGEPIIWRKLKRGEYVKVMTKESLKKGSQDARVYARQDEITKICTLYPENIDKMIEENGALSSVISDEIMFRSGFAAEATTEL